MDQDTQITPLKFSQEVKRYIETRAREALSCMNGDFDPQTYREWARAVNIAPALSDLVCARTLELHLASACMEQKVKWIEVVAEAWKEPSWRTPEVELPRRMLQLEA